MKQHRRGNINVYLNLTLLNNYVIHLFYIAVSLVPTLKPLPVPQTMDQRKTPFVSTITSTE